MYSTYTVLLDACVLYPAPLRDCLITPAGTGLFRARWTARIQDEWIRALLQNRPDLTIEQLQRTRDNMERAVPDCLVSGYENLAGPGLPDPNDQHVLSAAIKANADAIITTNLKHFPEHYDHAGDRGAAPRRVRRVPDRTRPADRRACSARAALQAAPPCRGR